MFNAVIGDDEYLLVLEAAAVEDVALLSVSKKVDPFSVTHFLEKLLLQVSISKRLPTPVHIALKEPDTVVIIVRIHRQQSNQISRYLDLLLAVCKNAEMA